MSSFPLPPPPPAEPPGARRSAGPAGLIVAAVFLGVALVALGVAIAFVLSASDDDDPETRTTTASGDDVDGRDDLLPETPGIPEEVPLDGFREVQATMTFTENATPRQMARIEAAWEANPRLNGVLFISAEELEEAMGFNTASLAAWGDRDDAAAIETFVCRFVGDPGVALVGVGTQPC